MDNKANETQLSVPEAVLLGHAMVQRVADNLSVRAFFIKGPASVFQGLRPPRASADVDVFVTPEDLETVLSGLRERGWRERPVDPDSRTFPKHSVTVDHPEWPCCIDVHFRFPGIENAPEDAFDVMWANTEDVDLAGQKVRVPTMSLGILILALHALRSPHLKACRQELDFLADLTEREQHAAALLDLAKTTGSLAAIRPLLADLLPPAATVDWPGASVEWRNRVLAKEPGSARFIGIAQAPLWRRPKMLIRLAFPTQVGLIAENIYADMSFCGRLKQHWARWTRFLRSAPAIAQDLSHVWKSDRAVNR